MMKRLFFLLAMCTACVASRPQPPLTLWAPVEPHPQVLLSEQREGYTCRLVEYNAVGEERVRSYLLVPDAPGPHPGLVLLHDHGARFDIGKEKLVRPVEGAAPWVKASARQWVQEGFDGVYLADSLASLGYVVLVPDALYWGSRSTALCRQWSRMQQGFLPREGIKDVKKAVYEGQRAVYDSLARRGVVWAEQTLNEDAAAARLLASLPQVDASRIGCFGWSMGAHRAWLLAAFCPEIKAGAALCWMTLKSTQAQPPTASDYSMTIPLLRDRYDFPEIARWLRPKPFFFLNGRSDKLFPEAASAQAFRQMQELYREVGVSGGVSAAGASSAAGSTSGVGASCGTGSSCETGADSPLRTEFFDGGHHCGKAQQAAIVDFFRSVL